MLGADRRDGHGRHRRAAGGFDVSVAETVPTWASISALSYTTNYNGATTNVSPIVNPVTVPVLGGGTVAQETRIDYTNCW